MIRQYLLPLLVAAVVIPATLISNPFQPQHKVQAIPKVKYKLAFASFSPLNTDIFIADGDGNNARPLLPHAAQDYNASFSAENNWIVFTSERNGSADIYRVHPDGTGLEQLTHEPSHDDQAAFSPDGKFLAFVSSRSGQADIYILNLASKQLRNLTNNTAGDFRPAWSPDGKWIAFSSDRDSKKPRGPFSILHSTEIYVVQSDGSNVRRMTHNDAFAGSPSWSADCKEVVYYEAELKELRDLTGVDRKGGTTQIVTINVADGTRSTVTTGPGEKFCPKWVKGAIAYNGGIGNNEGIKFTDGKNGSNGGFECASWSKVGNQVVFHRETGSGWPPFQKIHSPDPDFELNRSGVFPSFSPSGSKLICNSQRVGSFHNSILLMNSDGTHASVLFSDSVKSVLAPVYSPKGDKIAFGFGRFFQMIHGSAKADIGVIDYNGRNLKVLTDGKGNYGFPSWSPDGKQLVYRVSNDSINGLAILDIATGKSKVLTNNKFDNFPSWSATGEWIAFTGKREDDNYEIYIIKPDGSGLKKITDSPGIDAHCIWSPDGKWIAFSSSRGGFNDEAVLHPGNPQSYGDIYVMQADGSDLRRLTNNQYEEATPGWFPLL